MTFKWQYDVIMRGWRVVGCKDGIKYQSPAYHQQTLQLFEGAVIDMTRATSDAWYMSGINTFTLPAGR